MKTVAIVQSNYIPWKGYFDLVASVDEFILYDDVQYTRRDWRNRNRIKTPRGSEWLTIPVQVKGKYHQRIDETQVSDPEWSARHWKTLEQAYAASDHFSVYAGQVERRYTDLKGEPSLSKVNRSLIELICELLGIPATLTWSTDYHGQGSKTERLVSLCVQADATHYLSGPAAQSYLDESQFAAKGIGVSYMSYDGYPEYPQPHPPFDHHVTVLDLLFNTGSEAPRYMGAANVV